MPLAQLLITDHDDAPPSERTWLIRLVGVTRLEHARLGPLGEDLPAGRLTGAALASLMPAPIMSALRQWYLDTESGSVLSVVSMSPDADMIPWERLAPLIGPGVCIVRELPTSDRLVLADRGPGRLLATGWTGAPTLNLPGIRKELA